jgi:plasmid rolling circle replication initiator protein Rep
MPDITGSEVYLTNISPDDKPWDKNRALAMKVEGLYELGDFTRQVERSHQCSRQIEFVLKANDEGEMKLRLNSARFCRLRFCPICQWRKSLSWKARLHQAIPRIVQDYPTHRWLMLTLTVRNCPLDELRLTVAEMNKAWQRLSQRKSFPAIGYLKSTEVTRAEDDYAHPHFHVVMLVPASYFSYGYIKQADWVELWRKSLRVEYSPNVDVRPVKNRRRREIDPSQVHPHIDIISGVLEALKYSVKPADFLKGSDPQKNAAWLGGITSQLHKTRAVALGGVFKQYMSDEEPDDLVNVDGEKQESLTETEIKLLFGWREQHKRYIKEEHK